MRTRKLLAGIMVFAIAVSCIAIPTGVAAASPTYDAVEYFSDFVAGEDTSVWENNEINRWTVDTASGVMKGDNNQGVVHEMNKVSRKTGFADDFTLTARLRWPVDEGVPFQSGIIVRWAKKEIHVKLTYQQYYYYEAGKTLTGDLRGVLGPDWVDVKLETYDLSSGVKFYLGDILLFDGKVRTYASDVGESTVAFYTEQDFQGEAESAMEIDWVRYVPISYKFSIKTPTANQEFAVGEDVKLTASVKSGLSFSLSYKINGINVGSGNLLNSYRVTLSNLDPGHYSVVAVSGSDTSPPRKFTVVQPKTSGLYAFHNEDGSYTLNAANYAGVGTVAKVQFLVDGVPIGEDTSSPYSYDLPDLSQETHKLSAFYYNKSGILLDTSETEWKPMFTSESVSESYTNEVSYTVSASSEGGSYRVAKTLPGKTVTAGNPYNLGTDTVPVKGAILYKFTGVSGTKMQGGDGTIQLQNLWTNADKGYMVVLGNESDVRIQDETSAHLESTAFCPGLDEVLDLSKPFELLIKDAGSVGAPIQYWLKFGNMKGFTCIAEFDYATAADRTPSIIATGGASIGVNSIMIYELTESGLTAADIIGTSNYKVFGIKDVVIGTDYGRTGTHELSGDGAIHYVFSGFSARTMVQTHVAGGGISMVFGSSADDQMHIDYLTDGGTIGQAYIGAKTVEAGRDIEFDSSQPFEVIVAIADGVATYYVKPSGKSLFINCRDYKVSNNKQITTGISSNVSGATGTMAMTVYGAPEDLVVLTDGDNTSLDPTDGYLMGTILRAVVKPGVVGKLIVAGYTRNNAATVVEMFNVAASNTYQVKMFDMSNSSVSKVKVFLWDGTDSMKPVAGYDVKGFEK
ncbi:MAG: hypothetical protein IJN40_06570 [Clostridia bacterium]|nr:hypothetical protein [Clostridia bacterium]